MRDEIELISTKSAAENSVMQFRDEFLSSGERSINGSRGLHNYDKYDDWLWLVKECEKPDNKLLGVQATSFFAARKSDGKLVGCIELRHTLNDDLRTIGGHIGYSVVPAERNKGYATKMLKLVLLQAKQLGIHNVLLTCDADNIASNKTIMKCGGVLERSEPFICGDELYNKYWMEP